MTKLRKAFMDDNPKRYVDMLIDEWLMGFTWEKRLRQAARAYEDNCKGQAGAGCGGWEKWEADCEHSRKLYYLGAAIPRYSTVLADAMTVVDRLARLRGNPWMVTIMNWNYYGDRNFSVMFRDTSLINVEVKEYDESLPMAIAKAAKLVISKIEAATGGPKWPTRNSRSQTSSSTRRSKPR